MIEEYLIVKLNNIRSVIFNHVIPYGCKTSTYEAGSVMKKREGPYLRSALKFLRLGQLASLN